MKSKGKETGADGALVRKCVSCGHEPPRSKAPRCTFCGGRVESMTAARAEIVRAQIAEANRAFERRVDRLSSFDKGE